MDKPKVWLAQSDVGVSRLFIDEGWLITSDPDDADLIQFTGGEDVSPSYYGHERHSRTACNPSRDEKEFNIAWKYLGEKPMAGICRGAQLLNVVNGGVLYQHVTGHAGVYKHPAHNHLDDSTVEVTSTHHQMMIPDKDALWLLSADISTSRQLGDGKDDPFPEERDVEAVFYATTESLCYQPHPEYVGRDQECRLLYFKFIKMFMGLGI